MKTLQELLDQRSAIEREITAARNADRAQALAQIQALMSESGLTLQDLQQAERHPKKVLSTGSHAKVAPKYRDPASGTTWTGRGLKPKWLSAALESGKTLAEFAI